MLIFLPISYAAVLKNLTYYAHVESVLLEYIHLYHIIFNMVTVLLDYISSSTHYSSTNNNYVEYSIRVYRSLIIFLAKHFLLC